MNNPDERTAVDQFGKGDKYFGICALMVTLPGLPMFGHGQVEGYGEKYGMEYRRAYLDEHPDMDLVARHEREIFPVTHQRYLFSGVENFLLYDFFRENGAVDEDVFVYSNGLNGRRALVVFLNKYASAQGWIRVSAAALDKSSGQQRQKSLGDGLALHNDDRHYVIFHDQISGLEVLLKSQELHQKGMFFDLHAYQCRVFTSIQEVEEDEFGSWGRLYGEIGGQYVRDVFHQFRLVRFRGLHKAARELLGAEFLLDEEDGAFDRQVTAALNRLEPAIRQLMDGICAVGGLPLDRVDLATHAARQSLDLLLRMEAGEAPSPYYATRVWREQIDNLQGLLTGEHDRKAHFVWACLHQIHLLVESGTPETTRAWMDEFVLTEPVRDVLRSENWAETEINDLLGRLTQSFRLQDDLLVGEGGAHEYLTHLFNDAEAGRMLGVNSADGVLWYRKEALEEWINHLELVTFDRAVTMEGMTYSEKLELLQGKPEMIRAIRERAEGSNYQVDNLLSAAKGLPNSEKKEPEK
jgi:hypothetical protein